jgi:hypothetical protein
MATRGRRLPGIDLSKQIEALLPFALRKTRLASLLEVLVCPLTEISQRFCEQGDPLFYRANADGSVISLKHHIREVFDIACEIVEENGKPVDFRVMILSGNEIDLIRLEDFISRYKVAGKSFILQWSSLMAEFVDHICERVDYSIEFVEHLCERIDYSIHFSGFMCERIEALHIVATAGHGAGYVSIEIKTDDNKRVKSDLLIRVGVWFKPSYLPDDLLYRTYEITLKTDSFTVNDDFNTFDEDPVRVVIESITPSVDEYYGYLRDKNNIPDSPDERPDGPTEEPTEEPTPVPDPA